jgi:hypothetical protein
MTVLSLSQLSQLPAFVSDASGISVQLPYPVDSRQLCMQSLLGSESYAGTSTISDTEMLPST